MMLVGILGGCAPGHPGLSEIQSPDAGRRILAIKAAGEARDRQAVPLLVDRLEDEDSAVRMYAILALERIVGDRFGYDYGRPAESRVAVERWRQYARGAPVESSSARAAPPREAAAVESP